MFLDRNCERKKEECFLCVCRDVSREGLPRPSCWSFSLRVQRCFPCGWESSSSPWGFLCVCRDVSVQNTVTVAVEKFSLRVQRCFPPSGNVRERDVVFSACAEMFLGARPLFRPILCFLCVCRDVSSQGSHRRCMKQFSLRVQRCFPVLHDRRLRPKVFSACAEMFLVNGVVLI